MDGENKDEVVQEEVEELRKVLEAKNRNVKKETFMTPKGDTHEHENVFSYQKEIEHKLFKMLCPKQYLDDCEPAYCVFQITDSCEYLKIIRKLHKEIVAREGEET